MPKKSVDWNEGLLEDLKDPEFAKGFVHACLEEGIPLKVAVGKVVKAQGYSAVARRIHMAVPNVIRAAQPKSNPTLETFEKLMAGVGLKFAADSIGVTGVKRNGSRRLAKAI